MAERGTETLRHGPMKPVGLTNPHDPLVKPYAVVQLRQDNALGTLYNMVGFQTKLKHGEQVRIFRMIPGLENAEFARLGGLHRNTYINSPMLLDGTLQLKLAAGPALRRPDHRLRGLCRERGDRAPGRPVRRSANGSGGRVRRRRQPPPWARCSVTSPAAISSRDDEPGKRSFQPMNVNFGLFPPLDPGAIAKPEGGRFRGKEKALAKKHATTARALSDCRAWLGLDRAVQAAE